jgi:hypothetical protein
MSGHLFIVGVLTICPVPEAVPVNLQQGFSPQAKAKFSSSPAAVLGLHKPSSNPIPIIQA